MNIKNILFDIKGEKGGEVIYVFFSNVYGKTARGAKIIRLSDNCQTISIPLLLFDDGILELRSLCTITIQTIRSFGGSTKSHILIDNLAFDWTE